MVGGKVHYKRMVCNMLARINTTDFKFKTGFYYGGEFNCSAKDTPLVYLVKEKYLYKLTQRQKKNRCIHLLCFIGCVLLWKNRNSTPLP